MKKFYQVIVAVFMLLVSFNPKTYSQVAINLDGSAPDTSAILDIASTTKGLLTPRMTTIQRLALPNTIGLTVFDLDLNTLMFNTGTGWLPSSFTLPYAGSYNTSSPVSLFHVTSTGTNATGIRGETATNGIGVFGKTITGTGLRGEADMGTGIFGYSNTGTAGFFQAGFSTGTALSISGKINSNGSTGTNGSTLSINVSGFPTWQEPVAFAVNDLGTGDLSVAHNIDAKLFFTAEEFDLGGDFNLTTSEFTAPVKGVYHFDAFTYWNGHTNGVGYVAITLKRNGSIYATTREPAFTGEGTSNTIGVNILLNSGDKITCFAYQNSGVPQTLFQDGRLVKFSGYLVSRQ